MEVDESKTEPEKSTPDVTVKEEKEKDEVKDDKETKDEDKVKKEVNMNSFNYYYILIFYWTRV